MLVLFLFIVLNSCNSWNVVTPDASLVISMGADIASYPNRNCGCPRKLNHPNISPSFKVSAGIKLLNAGLCAYSLVLLAGDVSRNPGPANISQDSQNFSDIGFPSNRGLKIAHLNVRSITNKIDSLRLLLLNNPFDVLTISETWLTKNISDPELNIQVTSTITAAVCKDHLESGVMFAFDVIDECFVKAKLKSLKTNKAIGLDNISARLLKDSADVITTSLTKLYNRSLATSVFSAVWKCGKVTALCKSGDRCNANNYRLITILPTASKILERAVNSQVYSYLFRENILIPKQFGFRPKLSTAIALTYFTDNILDNLDKEPTINWFSSYLSNRFQVTSIGLEQSSTQPVHVGVPQRSILGPLLFLIYVNEIPATVNSCDISLYADDTVLFCSVKTTIELEQKLNSDLQNLSRWFGANCLVLNTFKCKFMVFGAVIPPPPFSFT
ncbi:Hypothetical predicted protein [Paramuricea clavata]|uniref:Uncharacterized protein n=1 Tax=Paramuricea clavata TaxID=317549 RepID=A0A6S7IYZ5_PARCT|nr:Hypothetical predicted protein [Paramuricea clavata]